MDIINHNPNAVLIPLTKGQTAIVDIQDADLIHLKWYACKSYDNFYAARGIWRAGTIFMHRVVLSRMLNRPLLSAEHVDHIHHNTLDNRRSEIRLATSSQNQHNQGVCSRNTSGYKGVRYDPERKKWVAMIGHENKRYNLGRFATALEAALAYDQAARELHGEFAFQNIK